MADFQKYKEVLSARISQLLERVEKGEASKEHVAFEVLWSTFSAFEAGMTHEDLKEAYPIEAWREDTVTIPRELAQRLAEGWGAYRNPESDLSLGHAFNLEGGKGKSPTRKVNRTLDAELRRSNKVVAMLLEARLNGNLIKQLSLFYEVAAEETKRTGRRVSPDTVRNAFRKHGDKTMEKLRKKFPELLDPPP
ncbi:hypothetical protein [Sulfitobacter sp. 1A15299]|uniref:hypothetical protein n=1 Tax=Sulfitobacter sp. 1A15299 TaxID=3368598 RepID=UPI003746D2C2